MIGLARLVAPGIPHHASQRGKRRLDTCFYQDDHRA